MCLSTRGWSPMYGHETNNNNNNSNHNQLILYLLPIWLKTKIFLKFDEEFNNNNK